MYCSSHNIQCLQHYILTLTHYTSSQTYILSPLTMCNAVFHEHVGTGGWSPKPLTDRGDGATAITIASLKAMHSDTILCVGLSTRAGSIGTPQGGVVAGTRPSRGVCEGRGAGGRGDGGGVGVDKLHVNLCFILPCLVKCL